MEAPPILATSNVYCPMHRIRTEYRDPADIYMPSEHPILPTLGVNVRRDHIRHPAPYRDYE